MAFMGLLNLNLFLKWKINNSCTFTLPYSVIQPAFLPHHLQLSSMCFNKIVTKRQAKPCTLSCWFCGKEARPDDTVGRGLKDFSYYFLRNAEAIITDGNNRSRLRNIIYSSPCLHLIYIFIKVRLEVPKPIIIA